MWFIWEGIPENQGEWVGREPWKKKNKWPVCCLDFTSWACGAGDPPRIVQTHLRIASVKNGGHVSYPLICSPLVEGFSWAISCEHFQAALLSNWESYIGFPENKQASKQQSTIPNQVKQKSMHMENWGKVLRQAPEMGFASQPENCPSLAPKFVQGQEGTWYELRHPVPPHHPPPHPRPCHSDLLLIPLSHSVFILKVVAGLLKHITWSSSSTSGYGPHKNWRQGL